MNKQYSKPIASGQRGATIVELAIILPLLVILLFGFIELGRALYQTNTLTKAVTVGARYLARAPGAVTTDCEEGLEWPANKAQAKTLVVYASDDDTGPPILPGLDAGAITFAVAPVSAGSGSGAVTACVITVQASSEFAAIFGDSIVPMLNLGPIELNAAVEERYIGD
ncbi:MAG: pilus assembly protein [Gammaproteobacteria bacterium]|nr:pilus assembly protein [Gammaproteobacteria bacterium]